MLEAKDISFAYGRHPVLDGASLGASPGEIVALTGANGSGKSTLLRILATLAYPAAGRVTWNGADVFREPVRYRHALGFAGELPVFEPDLTVKQYLRFRAKLKGELTKKIPHRVREALAVTGLEPCADRLASHLSYGLKKRVCLAEAVLLRPRVLLLDDPLSGLDAASRAATAEALRALSGTACIVLAGHETADFSRFATRILELADGKIR